MERMEGLDEEVMQEETKAESKVTSLEEEKKRRKPFHYWTINGVDHKMKLKAGMIAKLENKYQTNVINLLTSGDLPPLSVMLTVAQAAMSPWEHELTYDKVAQLYDTWVEEGGNQSDLLTKVIMPTLAVSGFFTQAMTESLLREINQTDALI